MRLLFLMFVTAVCVFPWNNREKKWKDAKSIFQRPFLGRRRCRIVRSLLTHGVIDVNVFHTRKTRKLNFSVHDNSLYFSMFSERRIIEPWFGTISRWIKHFTYRSNCFNPVIRNLLNLVSLYKTIRHHQFSAWFGGKYFQNTQDF